MPALLIRMPTSVAKSAASANRHRVGDVELERNHARIANVDCQRVAGSGIDLCHFATEKLSDVFAAHAAVGAGDEHGPLG